MSSATFAVVVPVYNEAAGMQATLDALASQSDGDFRLVIVDNGSTDASITIAERFAARAGVPATRGVREPQKGTGAAADTGCRVAIADGARTDADCIPHRDWVRHLKHAMLRDGAEFAAGRIKPRDDGRLTLRDRMVLPTMIWIAENVGRLHRRGPQFRYPYFMAAGNNLAITAELYLRSGGFPRSSIETLHEDRALSEQVRTLTSRGVVCDAAIVYNSVRRVRAYGYLNTLRWYRNHGYKPDVVDIR
jgi:glycosyltransferase involved in cell wall biosynthesis